ncbi:sugar phosphate isomerase/epimerase [uncultured Methanoregula sp.]|uniref:sugar phosphate isomerase/epimerase family protein n=1 Tax=uncultured Methanoregula sp. TaxID=1005933 RepID=UPI002AAAB323|nr:sugar phosphate isomerase/epimerase [uncultured Methanoregula sp.]
MVAYSVASMFFHEYTIEEIFSFVSRSGLNALEFWLETPHFWLRDLPVKEVLASKKAHPVLSLLTVHAPILDLNPCSINPEVAEVSLGYALRSIAIAEELGARVLTLHPGRRTAKRPPGSADFVRFDRYIETVRRTALDNSLKISMENMEPAVNSLLCTPERMRELLDAEPWLYFTLDVSHALAKSDEEPLRYIELCHDRLANVHISRVNGKTLHLPLDRSPAMATVMESLKEHSYEGSLTLEIEDLNFGRPLSSDEKIAVLARDRAFMQECME